MHVISSFDRIRLADAPTVGGKGANLGEMANAGFPVPPGFVVRAEAYLDAIDRAGVRAELEALRTTRIAKEQTALRSGKLSQADYQRKVDSINKTLGFYSH